MGLLNFLKPKITSIDFFERGVLKYKLLDLIGAKEDFSKVIKLDSTYSAAYLNRAKVNLDLKCYSEASSDFDRVIEMEPNNWEVYYYRGFLRYKDDYYSGAYSDLIKVVENINTNKEALLLFKKVKSILHTEKEKNLYILEPEEYFKNFHPSPEDIERELDMTINDVKVNTRFGPNYAKELNKAAHNFYKQGLFEQGISSAKEAIRNNQIQNLNIDINENILIYLNTLAIGYFYIGDYDKALDTINKCIDMDENINSLNSEHYTNRAKINIKLNQIEKAIEDCKKVLELDSACEEAEELLKSLI